MPRLTDFIRFHWNNHPLAFVLILGLIFRLAAAWFARGYLMVDDHFLVVEAAGSWADGFDYNKWLPWTENTNGPVNVSFFYVGIIWALIEVMQFFNLHDPDHQMLIIRNLHAFYSILTIYCGYKIALKLANMESARMVGLLLALFAFMPNFCVRQLVEMTCIPPLMAMFYFILKSESKRPIAYLMWAGVLAGVAMGIRYQVALFMPGIGLVLLFSPRWKGAFAFAFAAGFSFFLTQMSDMLLWHQPFVQLWEYITYNSTEYGNYPNAPWYNYTFTLLGFLIPPISVMLLFGFFRKFKTRLIYILPVLFFLIFHSIYPNKQERFILPILPIIITVGYVDWISWYQTSAFWLKRKWLSTSIWVLFWIINIPALLVFTFAYTKKPLVESMLYLRDQNDLTNFVWEYSYADDAPMPPQYYSDQWQRNFYLKKSYDIHEWYEIQQRNIPERPTPNYILFVSKQNKKERILRASEVYGGITFEKHCEPGFYDRLLHRINPINKAMDVYIYKIDNIFQESAE
jgi:hypothetical protein